MKQVVIALILVTCVAGYAQAVLDPDEDGIGVYFDPCGGSNCVDLGPGEQLAYLLITHPSAPMGVAGWECSVNLEGPVGFTFFELEGQNINIASLPGEFIVGLSEPLINPYSFPVVVIAQIHVNVLDTSAPVDFYIGSTYFHSLPNKVPAYVDGGTGKLKELRQSTGGPDFPVASINGNCAVATETETWGGIQALYH